MNTSFFKILLSTIFSSILRTALPTLVICLLVLAALVVEPGSALAVDPVQVEHELTGSGAVGWIHGAVKERDLYVFTYRNPDDFFDYMQFSMVPANDSVAAQLKNVGRHDRVLLKGSYLPNPSPQKHIEVTSIEVLDKFDPRMDGIEHQREAKIPDELNGVTEARFLVHAVFAGGQILVVEYKDAVLPVYVKNGALTKDLFRGDVVQLKFKIQGYPDRPSHLRINEQAASPVQVVERIQDLHGKAAVLEGALVLFPKSPEILFNVFAIEQEIPGGLKREFTLVNFESPTVFAKIREKLQKAWDRHPKAFVNGRNKYVSTKIRIRANGVFNDMNANQANPQILLKDENSISVIERY